MLTRCDVGAGCTVAVGVPATYRTINTIHDYGRCRSIPIGVRTVARTVGRILLTLTGLAITGFLLLVLIGCLDRHEQEITAGLSRIYQRYLASQADPSSNPRARAAVEAERAVVGRGRQVAMTETFQDQPKLVGTGAVGSANQGMAVALSADGNTAIVGGPGANNADRDRPPCQGRTAQAQAAAAARHRA